ncbi:MAG: hypothetical protein AB9903_03080 [Vulcanimicrobiota bacterium]
MDGISARPNQGANPAGAGFQHNTMGFIGKQAQAGNIDGFETQKISELQNAIKDKVEQDKSQGIDPQQDQELAQMQIQMRKMSDDFANFNPGKETGSDNTQGDTVELSDEQETSGLAGADQNEAANNGDNSFNDLLGQLAGGVLGSMTGGVSDIVGKLF